MSGEQQQYDLEERTLKFAKDVRKLMKTLPRTISTIEDGKQLIRSSGSIGANYIEANEALSKKDFKYRVKICIKEAKESRYWLRLIDPGMDADHRKLHEQLLNEAQEILNIFGAILRGSD